MRKNKLKIWFSASNSSYELKSAFGNFILGLFRFCSVQFSHVILMLSGSRTQKFRREASLPRRAISGSDSSDADLRFCLIFRSEILQSEKGKIWPAFLSKNQPRSKKFYLFQLGLQVYSEPRTSSLIYCSRISFSKFGTYGLRSPCSDHLTKWSKTNSSDDVIL